MLPNKFSRFEKHSPAELTHKTYASVNDAPIRDTLSFISNKQCFQNPNVRWVQDPDTGTLSMSLSVATLSMSFQELLPFESHTSFFDKFLPHRLQECHRVEHAWYHDRIEGGKDYVSDSASESCDCGTGSPFV